MTGKYSVVDPSLELTDPNPNIHHLFQDFNEMFFGGKLGSVYVQWSERMTLCAGTCKFHGRNRECSIQLSKPLLSLRPRKDLVETLLHEMIHAFLFVADGNRERESHGPKFHEHMYRINKMTGTNITVYHSFHDEVNHFKTHWWKCNGPCQHRHPYYGVVKRSMNRAPGPNDFWFKDHQSNCGGTFVKIKEPSPKKGTKRKNENPSEGNENKLKNKITNYFGASDNVPSATTTSTSTQPTSSAAFVPPPAPLPEPFSGRGFVLGSIGNSASSVAVASTSSGNKLGGTSSQQPPRRGEHPLLSKWVQNYKNPPSSSARSFSSFGARFASGNRTAFGVQSSSTSSSSTTSSTARAMDIEVIDLD